MLWVPANLYKHSSGQVERKKRIWTNFAKAEIQDRSWHKPTALPEQLLVLLLARTPCARETHSCMRWGAFWQLTNGWLTWATYLINHEPQIKWLTDWFRSGAVKLNEGYWGYRRWLGVEAVHHQRLEISLRVWDPSTSLCQLEQFFQANINKMWWWGWSANSYLWCPVNWAAVSVSLEQCWLVLHQDLVPWPSVIFIILFYNLSWCFTAPWA